MRVNERYFLTELVRNNDVKIFFEIGTNRGYTSNLISFYADVVYTLDIENRVNGLKFKTNVIQLFGDSYFFDFSNFYDKIDLVFIDGNHNLRFVRKDSFNAFKMVRDGGLIVWHDYDISRPDIVKFVNRFCKKYMCKVNHEVGTKLAYAKKIN